MSDRSILIIGASSEIGRAYIEENSVEYTHILAHYGNNAEGLSNLKEELGEKISLLKADLSSTSEIDAMLCAIDEMDIVPTEILFLSSPKMKIEHFKKSIYEDYEKHMSVSYLSTVRILLHMLPKMAKRKSGRILFMLSNVVTKDAPKFQAPYACAKYALLGLMKDLSNEYEDKGIKINAISPDMIETGFISELPELIVAQNAQNSPIGRNLTVADIIPKMEELLSDDFEGTGINIEIP